MPHPYRQNTLTIQARYCCACLARTYQTIEAWTHQQCVVAGKQIVQQWSLVNVTVQISVWRNSGTTGKTPQTVRCLGKVVQDFAGEVGPHVEHLGLGLGAEEEDHCVPSFCIHLQQLAETSHQVTELRMDLGQAETVSIPVQTETQLAYLYRLKRLTRSLNSAWILDRLKQSVYLYKLKHSQHTSTGWNTASILYRLKHSQYTCTGWNSQYTCTGWNSIPVQAETASIPVQAETAYLYRLKQPVYLYRLKQHTCTGWNSQYTCTGWNTASIPVQAETASIPVQAETAYLYRLKQPVYLYRLKHSQYTCTGWNSIPVQAETAYLYRLKHSQYTCTGWNTARIPVQAETQPVYLYRLKQPVYL